jgi:anthranilate synthase/aminodeoxychorismate synthase-like glutamine amidotransferase
MILVIDNYDSFVYNLVQYFGELGQSIMVRRNDEVSIEDIIRLRPSCLVISPGPGRPGQAGITCDAIRAFAGKVSILGVCLGHQAIAEVFGANITRSPRVVHGKISSIHHDGRTLFKDIDNPFSATRYHSLVVDRTRVPDCLELSAWTDDGVIMGLRHREYVIEGVQFHPESVLTLVGKRLLRNFIERSDV